MKNSKQKNMGNAVKRLLAATGVGVLTLSMLPLATASTVYGKNTHDDIEVTLAQSPKVTPVSRKTIKFGTYPQEDRDNDTDVDWDDATPITWQIIDDSDPENVLIISDKILDCKKFENNGKSSTVWENCSLRYWLNGLGNYSGEGFIDKAFNNDEKDLINEVTLENYNSTDKVFALSIDELTNPNYAFNVDGAYGGSARAARTTKYARSNGAETAEIRYEGLDNGMYWTLDNERYNAAYVGEGGVVGDTNSMDVETEYVGVRPALRINLKEAGLPVGEINVANDSVEYDTITMGSDNGSPINWWILKRDNNTALLFADHSLKNKYTMNDADVATSWENCSLRNWLNGTGIYAEGGTNAGEGFIDTAFTNEERSAIKTVTLDNNIGNTTQDKVYILSKEELSRVEYGFEASFLFADENRADSTTDSWSGYWTRTFKSGKLVHIVRGADGTATVGNFGWSLTNTLSVRPAMTVDLDQLCSLDRLVSVSVDDSLLTAQTDYSVTEKNGNIVITLKAEMLDSINGGKHTLTATFDNNGTITTSSSDFFSKQLLTVTAASDSKVYDGDALVNDAYSYTDLMTGDSMASVMVTGSQVDVGVSENVPSDAKIVNAEGKDVTDNYIIEYINGSLTVEEALPEELYITKDDSVSSWKKGSGNPLQLVFKRAVNDELCYEYFNRLEVDGKLLERDKDYTATKGSTIINISEAYLETLAPGEHTVTAVFEDGSVTTSINIEGADVKPNDNTSSDDDNGNKPSTPTDVNGKELSETTTANEKDLSTPTVANGNAPDTGDHSHLEVYVTVGILALVGMSLILVSNALKEE